MTERELYDRKNAFSAITTVTLDGLPILVLPEVAHAMGLSNGMAIDHETFRTIAYRSRALLAEVIRQEKLGAN